MATPTPKELVGMIEAIEVDELGIPKMTPVARNTRKCPAPGEYTSDDYSMEQYHEIDAANASTLKEFCNSGWHGEAYLKGQRKDPVKEMVFGTVNHSRVFEPEDYAANAYTPTTVLKKYQGDPELEKKHAKALLADGCKYEKHVEQEELHPGKIILRDGWAETIENIHASVIAHPHAKDFFFDQHAQREITWIWHHKRVIAGREFTIPCKARLDMWNPTALCFPDLKVTDKVDPWKFSKQMLDIGWYKSGGWYLDGAVRMGKIKRDENGNLPGCPFPMLAVERKPIAEGSKTHLATIHAPPVEILEQGYDELMKDGFSRYFLYRTLGIALPPAYLNNINPTDLPAYALNANAPDNRIGE